MHVADRSAAAHASVEAIWRYPVKSMAGEEVVATRVTQRGLLGDRLYALVDTASNRAATVRSWAGSLLSYRPAYVTEPQLDEPPPAVRISTPQGQVLATTDPDVDERLSAAFGRTLTVMASAPEGLLVELPKGTLGGAYADATDVPLAGAAPAGTFFDYACLHLIATSTLDHLQSVYPQGRLDVRRFRPNIVVRSDEAPFCENTWTGRELAIGDDVVLRITIPCPRCINVTLPQAELPRDPGILRMIGQHNMQDLGDFGGLPCAGVYADVVTPGTIHRGDAVRCIDRA
jgi:uncharacterized protein YcbX